MESYVLRLKFLIDYMMLLSLTHSEISEQYICGLKCALALVSETDDIDTIKTKIDEIFGIKNVSNILNALDVQPVKHGRWISQGDDMWLCSNCKENIIFSMHKSDRTEKQRYCCKCGARMDGDTE